MKVFRHFCLRSSKPEKGGTPRLLLEPSRPGELNVVAALACLVLLSRNGKGLMQRWWARVQLTFRTTILTRKSFSKSRWPQTRFVLKSQPNGKSQLMGMFLRLEIWWLIPVRKEIVSEVVFDHINQCGRLPTLLEIFPVVGLILFSLLIQSKSLFLKISSHSRVSMIQIHSIQKIFSSKSVDVNTKPFESATISCSWKMILYIAVPRLNS